MSDQSADAVSLVDSLGEMYDAQLVGSEPENKEEPEQPEISPEPQPKEDQPVVEALTAPEHWPKDRQEVFSTAPPELQQVWLDREKEFEQGIGAKSNDLRDIKAQLDQYENVIGPLRQGLQMQGMNEYQWISQMAAYTQALQSDPAGVLKQVAAQYGVDMSSLTGSDEFVDPQVQALTNQIAELKQQLSQTVQTQQTSVQEQQIQQLAAFRDQKDAEGKALHPHFDAVMDDMTRLAQGYRANGDQMPTLEELYSYALRMRPELTEADRQAAAQAEEEAKKQAALEQARKARSAGARPKDTATDAGALKPPTLEQELAKNYDALMG